MNNIGFDPNAAALDSSGIFGLPNSKDNSALVYLPVPWEATTSYGQGTALGPSAILNASHQVDLFDLEVLRPYEPGLFMMEENKEVIAWNKEALESINKNQTERVNELGAKLNQYVSRETAGLLASNKIPAIIGGDHSSPFGALEAVAARYPSFGVLHFDAHMDLRQAFDDFTWSHASILFNALEKIPQITKLVQVGIRDFCEQEWEYASNQGDRVKIFYDIDLARARFDGKPWSQSVAQIISTLPKEVWISFDIDALDPRYCPATGTPVPGGLDFNEAIFIFSALVKSGRKIIGFDLCEVGGVQWDANVGARLLYKLSAWALVSHGLVKENVLYKV